MAGHNEPAPFQSTDRTPVGFGHPGVEGTFGDLYEEQPKCAGRDPPAPMIPGYPVANGMLTICLETGNVADQLIIHKDRLSSDIRIAESLCPVSVERTKIPRIRNRHAVRFGVKLEPIQRWEILRNHVSQANGNRREIESPVYHAKTLAIRSGRSPGGHPAVRGDSHTNWHGFGDKRRQYRAPEQTPAATALRRHKALTGSPDRVRPGML